MIHTCAVAPVASPTIVQVTVWPVVVHVPESAAAPRIFKLAGTASVKVILPLAGPALATVKAYAAPPPAMTGEGVATPVTEVSWLCTTLAETLSTAAGGPPRLEYVVPADGAVGADAPRIVSDAVSEPPVK